MTQKEKRIKTNKEIMQEIMNETLQEEEACEANRDFVSTLESKIQENEEQLNNYCSMVNYKLNGHRVVEVEAFRKVITGVLFMEYSNNIQDYMVGSEYTLEDMELDEEELEEGFVFLTAEEKEKAIKNEQKKFLEKFEELFVRAVFRALDIVLKSESNVIAETQFFLA